MNGMEIEKGKERMDVDREREERAITKEWMDREKTGGTER